MGKRFGIQIGVLAMKNNKQNLSELWDVFDYIGVVCYTGYVDRVRRLRKELARVGLEDRVVYHWDYPNPFEEKLISSLHFQCEGQRKPSIVDITIIPLLRRHMNSAVKMF